MMNDVKDRDDLWISHIMKRKAEKERQEMEMEGYE